MALQFIQLANAFHRLKFRSYLTKVHQIFTQCSLIIVVELYEIGFAISDTVLECCDYALIRVAYDAP